MWAVTRPVAVRPMFAVHRLLQTSPMKLLEGAASELDVAVVFPSSKQLHQSVCLCSR